MRRSILYLMPIFAMSLAASGCSQTSGATDGAGYAMLTPSGATRQFIIANDQAVRAAGRFSQSDVRGARRLLEITISIAFADTRGIDAAGAWNDGTPKTRSET